MKCTLHLTRMLWSSLDIIHGLYIVIGVMLVVVLYHVIFIVVDLRKVMKRTQIVTEELQTVILKPLSMADQAMAWVSGFLDEKTKKHDKKND
ncbi:hypothetical protein K8942_04350 [Candidatus Peribacteria bacterium]|nr:MAG: hypothetical protein K8942_04350 [Candidatus Peribacteria bacterium]